MLCNDGLSNAMSDFLDQISTRVNLKGFDKYRADLDVKSGLHGEFSYYTEYENHEIMFNVAPLIPTTKTDGQCIQRKGLVANAFVCIVFQEPGSIFMPDRIAGRVTQVFITVQPIHINQQLHYKVDALGQKSSLITFVGYRSVFGDAMKSKPWSIHPLEFTKRIRAFVLILSRWYSMPSPLRRNRPISVNRSWSLDKSLDWKTWKNSSLPYVSVPLRSSIRKWMNWKRRYRRGRIHVAKVLPAVPPWQPMIVALARLTIHPQPPPRNVAFRRDSSEFSPVDPVRSPLRLCLRPQITVMQYRPTPHWCQIRQGPRVGSKTSPSDRNLP